ncbi:MAG: hypothetical protein IPQ07_39105 [Myxococcales bacterium]|nr:hypothetical protein [Myxococcales bacterium]
MSMPLRVLVATIATGAAIGPGGCSAPPQVRPPQIVPPIVATTPPPHYTAPPIDPPLVLVAPALRTRCSTVRPGVKLMTPTHKIYDLAAIDVAPVPYGPRVEFSPHEGFVRSPESIEAAVMRQRARLVECLRAALGAGVQPSKTDHGGPTVTVDLDLTIDPFGFPADVKTSGDPKLARCVKESLEAIQVSRRTPRATRISTSLVFWNLRAVKPLQKAPPPPPTPAREAECLHTLEPLPVDTLTPSLRAIDVGIVPGEPRVPCSTIDRGKREIRDALLSNLGAYRACQLEATRRHPGLTGTVSVEFELASTGVPLQLVVGGDGDPELHRCLQDAIAAIGVGSSPTPTHVVVPFLLVTPPPTPKDPAAAIAALDLDTAVAQQLTLARGATSVDAACRARVGIVTALAAVPWTVDARVLAATVALAKFVAEHDRAALASCVADVLPLLERIGRWPLRDRDGSYHWRGGGLAEAVDRSLGLVALFPELGRTVEPFIADGLHLLGREEESLEHHVRVIELGGLDHAQAIRTLRGYHESATADEQGSEIDACDVRYPR